VKAKERRFMKIPRLTFKGAYYHDGYAEKPASSCSFGAAEFLRKRRRTFEQLSNWEDAVDRLNKFVVITLLAGGVGFVLFKIALLMNSLETCYQ
jgi:hypothetical protein